MWHMTCQHHAARQAWGAGDRGRPGTFCQSCDNLRERRERWRNLQSLNWQSGFYWSMSAFFMIFSFTLWQYQSNIIHLYTSIFYHFVDVYSNNCYMFMVSFQRFRDFMDTDCTASKFPTRCSLCPVPFGRPHGHRISAKNYDILLLYCSLKFDIGWISCSILVNMF